MKGVLLVNLGSPDTPEPADVKNYLKYLQRYASSCSLLSPAGIMVGNPGIQHFSFSLSQRDLRFFFLGGKQILKIQGSLFLS